MYSFYWNALLDSDTHQNDKALFDVIVSIPAGGDIDALVASAQQFLKLGEPQANVLRYKLAETKAVMVKSAVPQERAEELKSSFTEIGFKVLLKRHLSIAGVEERPADTRTHCPACEAYVELGPERQCPKCGVFVDKITPEMLLRKKIMAQERMKMASSAKRSAEEQRKLDQEALERRIREEVQEELEREMGLLSSKAQKQIKLLKIALPLMVVASAASAFYTGRVTAPASESAQVASGGANPQQLVENFLRGSAQMGQAMAQNGDLSLSEIIASASQGGDLPTSLNATNTLVSGAQGTPHAPPRDSLIALASAAASLPQSAGQAPVAAPLAAQLTEPQKFLVAEALTRSLAEMGHVERAREMLRRAYALNDNGNDYRRAITLRLLHIEVEAWAMTTYPLSTQSADQWRTLQQAVAALPLASDRAIAYASIGRILNHAGVVHRALSTSAFEAAAQALTQASGEPGREKAMNLFMMDLGENLFIQAKDLIRQGSPSTAALLASEIADMASEASPEVAAVLSLQAHLVYRSLGREQDQRSNMNMAIANAYIGQSNPNLDMLVAIQRLTEQAAGKGSDDLVRVATALVQRLPGIEGNVGAHGTVLAMYKTLGAQTEANLVRDRLKNISLINELAPSVSAYLLLEKLADARHAKQTAQYPEKERLLRDVASSVI